MTIRSLYRLKIYLKKYQREYLLGLLYIILGNAFYTISPLILKYTIDSIQEGISARKLTGYALLIVAVSFLHLIFRFLMRYTLIGASRKIEYDLRNDFFAHLLKLPMSFYHEYKTGDMMARATNDLGAVRNVAGPGIMQAVMNLLLVIYVISLMWYTNVTLTLVILLPLPMITITAKIAIRHIFSIYERVQTRYSDMTAKVQENIAGMRVIKAYVQEINEVRQFEKLNLSYLLLNLKLTRVRALLYASLTLFMGLGMMALLWMGGVLVVRHHINIGDFIAFTVWLSMLAWPLVSFGWIINMIQQGAASMGRINEIMDIAPTIRDDENTDFSIKSVQGEIEFRHLSFAYGDRGPKVLEDINLKIPAGKTLAIIGPTGSGKTTLVNLICRLIETQEGEVCIDGVRIQKIPLKILRNSIGYVLQETFLFSESIAENITFGKEVASFTEMDRAAELSTIKFDIEDFPENYQTIVGERGITLSGGQKQRTALSRAIIRHPKILILDDAFSSIDAETEKKILDQFSHSFSRQTTILISQRISTIQSADFIVVMDRGRIVERGTHRDLLQRHGLYAELYRKQLLERAIEEM